MDAKNYALKTILDGTQQYLVPIYQREYSWRQPQWEQLWIDIVGLDTDSVEDHHFLGSIVSKSFDAKAGGISKFLLIDGQQRLTTLTLLLAALRDLFRRGAETGDFKVSEMIQDLYLTNHYSTGDDFYKVLPTKTDRATYSALINSKHEDLQPESKVLEAYEFFLKSIDQWLKDEPNASLQLMLSTITDRMELVSITLGSDDNDYRIFESLNATGTPLTQTDLLRNFFLIRIPDSEQQDRIYTTLVRPITSDVDAVDHASSDTLFQYSLQRTGEYVRDKDVFAKWKRACDGKQPDQLEIVLNDILRDSRNYLKLVDPDRELDGTISKQIRRFNLFGVVTATPFLLNAYRWYEDGRISNTQLARIIQLVESFVVRRMFAGIPNNALNRIFIRLAHQMPDDENLVDATHKALSAKGLRWPNDEQFGPAFINYQLYIDSRSTQRQLVLQALEQSFGHKEAPEPGSATVEHIMPQTLNTEWREYLGNDAESIHQKYLHTIGNLTLTGYNSELGNMSFDKKRGNYSNSNFDLNKHIAATYSEWNESEIVARAGFLLDRAKDIWVKPQSIE